MNVKAGELGKPKCEKDLVEARQAYSDFISVMASVCIPFALLVMPLAIYLSYHYSAKWLWPSVRPFWNPIGLFLLACVPLAIIIRLSPFGRRHEKRRPVIDAVLAYDAARKAYERWKKSRRKSALMESHDKLLVAMSMLDELPDFQTLHEEVERAVQNIQE